MAHPKEYIWDSGISNKARSMCARHSDEFISNYLGMCIGQVRSIRRSLPTGVGKGGANRAPYLPASQIATNESRRWRDDAIIGSSMLAERINAVFGRGG